MSGALAVALHDVEPQSFSRSREIRQWLLERGVSRVTLLVIPASDLHPIGARAPALACWLRERVACGDTVAQHGLAHRASVPSPWPWGALTSWQGGSAREFLGLDREDAAFRVQTGRRLLREIELDPRGFVAPGYAYTRALRDVLAESHEWFADMCAVNSHTRGTVRSRALCLGTSSSIKRALSPPLIRAAGRAPGKVMRLDIHPADFGLPRHVATLESLLERAACREVVTYDELAA